MRTLINNHEYVDSEKNFDLLNNFLNYVSDDMSLEVFDNEKDRSVIKIYDDTESYMITWVNKEKCKRETDTAGFNIDHQYRDQNNVFTIKEKRIFMQTRHATALVNRAKELIALHDILTK